ncbi:MAG: N,N-dimethylformamidase beta subunit family domain-containing protein, partial [Ktedonobacteraceae bacterium]
MTNETRFDIKTLRSPVIEGYAWKTSAIAGDTVSFSVSTTAASLTATIYRLGWYQGLGGRLLQTITDIHGHFYPMPATNQQTGLIDANWPASFSIKIEPDWVTGIYIAKLIAADGTEAYAPFVVRSVQPTTFVFMHGDITDQAYNAWGGKSLYDFNSTGGHRAYKVSFNRPLT